MKCLSVTAAAGALMLALTSQPASAQKKCPEGMKNGQCVSPGLAKNMRMRGRVAAQPKVSQTAAPVPTADSSSPQGTRDYFETNRGVFRSAPCRRNTLGPGITC